MNTINIWIGNTFRLLPTIPDKSFDLIITDPPYDLSNTDQRFLQKQFLRISNGSVIVFCPPENQWIEPPDQYLFWIKPISTKNTSKSYSRFVEMIFYYNNGASVWNVGRHWSQYTNVFTDLVDESNHPHRKPPSLIRRLMLNHSMKGNVVLDPFAGSCVVGEVAMSTGREFLGIETDLLVVDDSMKQYCARPDIKDVNVHEIVFSNRLSSP